MKVVIHGNQEEAIIRVEKLLVESKNLSVNLRKEDVVCIHDRINGLSIADLVEEDNAGNPDGYKLAIFLGNAPKEEVELALRHEMRVLLILVPIDHPFNSNVTIGKTTNATHEESLEKDLVSVLSTFVEAEERSNVG